MRVVYTNIFSLLFIVFGTTLVKGSDVLACCKQQNIDQKCYFLCDESRSSSFFDQLKCAFQRAKLLGCKTKEVFDVVALFGKRFTDTVQKGWESLSTTLKEKLADAHKFSTVSIDNLKLLNQDMLSSLNTLKAMTADQFSGLTVRFKDFTTENLKQVINKVNINVTYSKWKDLTAYKWDKSQLYVIAQTAYKKYGENVENWSSESLKKLGQLMSGLPTAVFSKISMESFQNSLQEICDARLSFRKKINLMIPAKKVFGDHSRWNSSTIQKLCNLVNVFTPDQILSMKSKEIMEALASLKIQVLSKEQKEAVVKKLRDQWGRVSEWSTIQLKNASNFVEGFELSDINGLNKEKIQELLVNGKVKIMSKLQQRALYKQIVSKYGEPNTWTVTMLQEQLLDSLSESDLKKILKSNLIKALERSDAEWSKDQADYLLKILKSDSPTQLPALNTNQIVKLGSILKAFSESDAGRLTKGMLFLAFPQLPVIIGISEPVLQHFKKVYVSESKNGEIKSLGQFVNALSRHDISQETIADLLGNLKGLVGVDINEAQAAELMVKLRKKLGDFQVNDHSDKIQLPWGFQNLKKIGRVILSLNRKEAEEFPMKGIENTIEELGKQDGWKRRLVLAFLKRVKEQWANTNMTIKDLKEIDVELLGKFAQGFSLEDLNALSEEAKLMAIQKLGEYTGLPEDKLKSRANFAYQYLKKLHGELQSSDVKTMGKLLSGLSKDLLSKLSSAEVADNLKNLLEGADEEKFKEIVKKMKGYYKESDLSKWTATQWEKVLPFLAKLSSVEELNKLTPESLDELLYELGSIKSWTRDQAAVLMRKAKEKWGTDISQWQGKIVHQLGSIFSALSLDDVSKITKTFMDNLNSDLLEGDILSETLKRALAQRFTNVYLQGNVSKLSSEVARRFHYLLAGLDLEDLKKININNMDMLDALGNKTDWDTEQVKVLGQKAAKYLKENDATKVAYSSLKNLLKGFKKENIADIPNDAFLSFAGKFGDVKGLNTEQKRGLIEKAKSVWGNVSQWNSGQVIEAKNFLGGLDPSDISKLNPSDVARIPVDVFNSLNDKQIQALTAEQIQELDKEQIKTLSSQQINAMSEPKSRAVRSVMNEDPEDEDPYGTSDSTSVVLQLPLMVASILCAWLLSRSAS